MIQNKKSAGQLTPPHDANIVPIAEFSAKIQNLSTTITKEVHLLADKPTQGGVVKMEMD